MYGPEPPDIIKRLPKQVIDVIPAGGGVAEMKEAYERELRLFSSRDRVSPDYLHVLGMKMVRGRLILRRGQRKHRSRRDATTLGGPEQVAEDAHAPFST